MPFWWRRRKRFWFNRWKPRRRFTYKRRKRRFTRKRRYRRAPRRRRRRRAKVRRKRKTITVKQWQPDRIVNCKIKGFSSLVIGAEGTQCLCYTNEKKKFTPPQYPGGGGFGIERYTLQYLYEESKFRHNIWTKSNILTDLCRYLRCKIIFFRHPKTDFVVSYSRQPPFTLEKYTYPLSHPFQLLLSKHKKVVLSKKTKPNGKLTTKMIIKPPKQMLTKWFFQKQFATHDLFQLTGAAASFDYPRLGCCNENRIISIYYLNPQFYQNSNWGAATTLPYMPYASYDERITYTGKIGNQTYNFQMQPSKWQKPTGSTDQWKYYMSIDHDTGWFNPKILGATRLHIANVDYAHHPISAARYNPAIDDGVGNKVYWVSITGGHYDKPTQDDLIYSNMPLWQIFFGFWNYIEKKRNITYLDLGMFVVESQYIQPQPSAITKQYYPIIDYNFILGNNPFKAYISSTQRKLWFPTCQHQLETINSIVQTGPYITKYNNDRDSTWELPYKYIFYFKWGGPDITDDRVADPKTQKLYPVPDTFTEGLQISNPLKQNTESILHSWDFRRSYITSTAFKRMCENLESDSSLETDTEVPKKRQKIGEELPVAEQKEKKIKKCLLSLCEEPIYQETQETPETLLNLIKQQREQQQQLKHNLLIILQEMKEKQRMLQLTTGILD
nr:MAG: ORF1 [Torque teno midi virus]